MPNKPNYLHVETDSCNKSVAERSAETVREGSREQIRSLLHVGNPGAVRPIRVLVEDREAWSSVWRQRVVLVAPDGHEVPCYFLTPSQAAPWGAAVIAVHQHNGEFELGKSEAVGLVGSSDMAYGLELAKAGFPVLAPDLCGFEERMPLKIDPARGEQLDAWAHITKGETLLGLHVADIALATSWLEDNADVVGPIGIIGHSLGGQVAFFGLAVDPRLRAGVISCGVGTLESFETNSILHSPAWYVPGLRAAGDSPVVAHAVLGQKVMVVAGREDPIFPFAGVQSVASSFESELCEFVPFDGGHEFPSHNRKAALEWLGEALRPTGLFI